MSSIQRPFNQTGLEFTQLLGIVTEEYSWSITSAIMELIRKFFMQVFGSR